MPRVVAPRRATVGLVRQAFHVRLQLCDCEAGTDNGFALVLPHAYTEAVQIFLDRLADTLTDDEHAVMVLDQAGCHGSGDLVVPTNFTLVPLPPYSRRSASISGDSITCRSLRPLPCSTRMMPSELSICLTLSFTTSLTRRPAP